MGSHYFVGGGVLGKAKAAICPKKNDLPKAVEKAQRGLTSIRPGKKEKKRNSETAFNFFGEYRPQNRKGETRSPLEHGPDPYICGKRRGGNNEQGR